MKLLLLTSIFVLCLVGCATPNGPEPTGNDAGELAKAEPTAIEANDPSDADLPEVSAGPDLIGRAQSAMEGAVLGAVIGAQAGPIGAAVGAGALLVYGAITGHVPLAGSSAPGGNSRDEDDRERDMEEELRKEEQRGEHLEDEIEAELKRQEELLREIEAVENDTPAPAEDAPQSQGIASIATSTTEPESPSDASLSERANPRAAPKAPRDRELPLAIFDKEKVTIPRGAWQNERKLTVVKRSLDADMDGRPEQIRYYDTESETLLRLEQDTDYDGDLDTWQTYEDGKLATRQIDASDNGRPDVWETYRDAVMRERQVDRDGDGVRDAFYEYEGDSLIRERHDANGDGTTDLVVQYENRLRVRAEEDSDRDGRVDTWTTYEPFESEELVARIERDTDGSGKVDLVETYGEIEGRAALTRREEDRNGDGEMDIKSIYENGKLVRREISDPSLVPL